MIHPLIEEVEKNSYRKGRKFTFAVGDTVEVHYRVIEEIEKRGGKIERKERIQVFTGTVIAKRGSGTREIFTVRRIVQGEGVERTFPVHSPNVVKVLVKRRGKVRRAKLYYLRDRVGRATRVEELRDRKRTGKKKAGAD